MIRCIACRKEKPEPCGDCSHTAGEVGLVEILWDGLIAMRAEVSVCHDCNGAWLKLSTRNIYLCGSCRLRALRVEVVPDGQLPILLHERSVA
jgi:hypothetical protein